MFFIVSVQNTLGYSLGPYFPIQTQILNESLLTGWQQRGDFGGPVLLMAAEGASDIGVDTYLPQTGCIRNRYTASDAGPLASSLAKGLLFTPLLPLAD